MLSLSVCTLAALALAAPWIHRLSGRWSGWILAAGVAVIFGGFVAAAPRVLSVVDAEPEIRITDPGSPVAPPVHAGPIREVMTWGADLGLALSFRLDALALMMALLVTGVGVLVVLYAGGYLRGHASQGYFYSCLLAFMASMLGLVLADNVLLLFVFWELTSVTSFLLISFEGERAAARRAALQALLTTGIGGLAMLAGLLLLGRAAGSFELSEILVQSPEGLQASPLFVPAAVLILLGCLTKSAQFPFWGWLPRAMEAPTPVSAYLHSSTMVKAGVFLVARLSPVCAGSAVWDTTLLICGAVTMLLGALLGTRQTGFKAALAATTVASLGTMMMLLGLVSVSPIAGSAAVVFLFAHAMYKGALFMVAGNAVHATHTADADALGGLARAMPFTTFAGAVAALSMIGLPLLAGFAGKELLLKSALEGGATLGGVFAPGVWLLPLAAGLGGALMGMVALQVGIRPFLLRGADTEAQRHAHEGSPSLWIGPCVLAIGGVVMGAAPGLFAAPLLAGAADAVRPGTAFTPIDVGALLKPGAALWISLGAAATAVLLFAARAPWRALLGRAGGLDQVGPQRLYEAAYAGTLGVAAFTTRVLQNGSLARYVRVVVASVLAAGWPALIRAWHGPGLLPRDGDSPAPDATPSLVGLVMIAGAIVAAVGVVLVRARMAVIALLGVVGVCAAMIFVLYGAPDVAMTQFAVETLSVVIFVLVLYHLPRYRAHTFRWSRLLDGALSVALGGLMGGLVLLGAREQLGEPVSNHLASISVPEAYGRNVVNVIIVDFRALDTLGEIAVLLIAALGVLALLRVRADAPQATPTMPPTHTRPTTSAAELTP
jgi:multicomponent Na+:H+ antiporter subunit A